jgi:hypothetical protein
MSALRQIGFDHVDALGEPLLERAKKHQHRGNGRWQRGQFAGSPVYPVCSQDVQQFLLGKDTRQLPEIGQMCGAFGAVSIEWPQALLQRQ